jgi:hypothetical protein
LFDSGDLAATGPTVTGRVRTAAFIVLAHAEIEFAIEQECKDVAEMLENAAEPGTAMLAWGFISVREDGAMKHGKEPLKNLAGIYKGLLEHNNGIKKEHLESMLTPIGVGLASLSLDVTVLDEFGKYRGPLAHQPVSRWTTTDLPSTVKNKGVQAGQATDRIIQAIRSTHSSIRPAAQRRRLRVGRRLANWLRKVAAYID